MELDDDVRFLLDLKFNTVREMVIAFKKAIKADEIHSLHQQGIRQEVLMQAVSLWAKEGAPKEFDITEENVDLILTVKFGSVQKAYNYWTMMVEPGTQYGLTDIEYKRLLDYIPSS